MVTPKILQAKINGTFYEYCEELLNKDPIYGDMDSDSIAEEYQKSLKDFDEMSNFEPQYADTYKEMVI